MKELREFVLGQTHPTVEDLASLQCHAVREQPEFSLCLGRLPLLFDFFRQSRSYLDHVVRPGRQHIVLWLESGKKQLELFLLIVGLRLPGSFPFSGAFLEICLRSSVLNQESWYKIAEEDTPMRHPVPLNSELDLLLRPPGKCGPPGFVVFAQCRVALTLIDVEVSQQRPQASVKQRRVIESDRYQDARECQRGCIVEDVLD